MKFIPLFVFILMISFVNGAGVEIQNSTITGVVITPPVVIAVIASDGNASSICSGDQVLLGNGSCQTSTDFAGISSANNPFDQVLNISSNVTFFNLTVTNTNFQNITLTDRILFRLGATIDNLINGVLRITGNLDVTGAINSTDWGNVTITQSQISDFSGVNFTNVAFQNNSVGDGQIFRVDQALENDTRLNFRGSLEGDTYFFYNSTNGTLMLFVNKTLQQSWGSSTTIFEKLTVKADATIQNLEVQDVIGDQVNLNASLNATGNITTLGFFIGNGSKITDVCLSTGVNCANVTPLDVTNVAFTNQTNNFTVNQTFDQDIITKGIFATFFNWIENSIYLSFDGFTLSFNEAQLNATIDNRISISNTTDTTKGTVGPFLFNDTTTIFFNDTLLNETILLTGAIFNDTTLLLSINTTSNIEALNFTTGPHTIDTDTNTEKSGGQPYLFNNSNTIFLNETFLNQTIDDRISLANFTVDTQKNTAGPFLFNDSITIFFNSTLLNETIILVAVFNETDIILSINTTSNIEALGFVTGVHTIDTSAATICSTDEVLLGNGSCATSSAFGTAADFTNVAFTNESNTFDLNQTFSQDITTGGIFATFYNWITNSIYLIFDGSTLTLNETQLNITIDNRISLSNTTDTQKNTQGPFLSNDSTTIFFNATLLNETILSTGAIFNDTDVILSINTTENIEALNFTTGPHTIDTNTDTNASTACTGNEVLLGNASCQNTTAFLASGAAVDFTNVAFTNETNTFDLNQTFSQDITTGGIFATFFNWITDSIYLIFDGSTLTLNETQLNATIDDRISLTNVTADSVWDQIGSFIFPKDFETTLVGLGTNTPNATLDIFSQRENFSLTECLNPGVMCYRFEAGSRDLAIDTSLIFNTAIISGATRTNSSGLNGTGNVALNFTGNDFVHAPSIDENKFREGFSLSAWVSVNSKGTNYVISKFTNDTEGYSLHFENDERLYFTVVREGILFREKSPANLTVLQGSGFHHIGAVFYDNNTIELYIDGAGMIEESHNKPFVSGSNDLFIGIRSDVSQGFDGLLDEVALINETANSSLVANIALNGFNLIERNITKAKNVSFAISSNTFGDVFIVDEFGRVGINTPEPSLNFEVNKTARFFGDVVLEEDLFIGGVIVGGSPVKIVGGIDASGGDIENTNRIFADNITSDNAVTAVQFIDLTPAYDKTSREALDELTAIRNKSDGKGGIEIDHSTLPNFVKVDTEIRNVTSGNKITVVGRSIGAMISMIIEAIRSLNNEDDKIKAELCRKDNTYSWC